MTTILHALGLASYSQDNLCLVHPETLAKINEPGGTGGPSDRSRPPPRKVRGDTFVVKTNIHYPTDANLLAGRSAEDSAPGGAQLASLGESGRLASGSPSPPTCLLAWSGPSTRPASRRKAIWQGGGGSAYRPLLKLTHKVLARAA